jgi:nucleoside-diphosphate-sugar epimerase
MSIHRLCEAAVRGTSFPRYGNGEQIREFTYVSDIAAANLAAADREITPGAYVNIAGGAEITLNDLIALVGEVAGSPVAVDPEPQQPGDSFRNGGSIARARDLLGWTPEVSLRDGIAAQVDWHRARV